MNLSLIKEDYLVQLKAAIEDNRSRYTEPNAWLDDFFGHSNWKFETDLNLPDIELVHGGPESDGENACRIYTAWAITPNIATDERIWAWATHDLFRSYMQIRWPVGSTTDIKSRYFFGQKLMARNGLSRLWWGAYLTYDKTQSDPFALTRFLFEDQDRALNLLERNLSNNPAIVKGILQPLSDIRAAIPESNLRDLFRNIMIWINREGGLLILDALQQNQIAEKVKRHADKLMQQQLNAAKKSED